MSLFKPYFEGSIRFHKASPNRICAGCHTNKYYICILFSKGNDRKGIIITRNDHNHLLLIQKCSREFYFEGNIRFHKASPNRSCVGCHTNKFYICILFSKGNDRKGIIRTRNDHNHLLLIQKCSREFYFEGNIRFHKASPNRSCVGCHTNKY